jgi:hypothetical protein
VEVEQIIVNDTLFSGKKPLISSFVQVRASIPVYWYQQVSFIQNFPFLIQKLEFFANFPTRNQDFQVRQGPGGQQQAFL